MPRSSHKRIKILHVLHSFSMGGLENGVVNLINNSDHQAFAHELCCITRSGDSESRIRKQINVFEMNKRPGNDLCLPARLVKLIRQRQPDIVHTRNWGAMDAAVAAKLARVPGVVHSEHGWNSDDPLGRRKRRLIARKAVSYGIDFFVAVSEDIRNWLTAAALIHPRKIVKIVNGVDTDKFSPLNHRPQQDEFVIGIVGRLDPIKNHDKLLEAFSRLDHKRFNLKLLIIGDGPERSRLESQKDRSQYPDRIVFMGKQNDLSELYRLMQLFVLPSQNEGMSNTVLEAMATSLPVVATDVGGNTELVVPGETGLLVPPCDVESLVSAINRYLMNPEQMVEHGREARRRVQALFSLKRMVRDYEDMYASLMTTRPRVWSAQSRCPC